MSDDEPTPSRWVNQYELLQELGAGSFGRVRLARTKAGEQFAVKILDKMRLRKKRTGRRTNALDDAFHEIAVMKRLQHPNVALFHELIDDVEGKTLYIVMEFLPGGSVEEALMASPGKPPRMAPADLRRYVRGTLLGLAYMHRSNMIHRDIKPENILLAADGTPKLADFGTSELFDSDQHTVTRSAGTPAFYAPEACEEGSPEGEPLDVWALGVTLFYCAYGQVPFMAATVWGIADMIAQNPVVYPDVPVDADLLDLMHLTLEKDPAKRATVAQVAAHAFVTEGGKQPLDIGEGGAGMPTEEETAAAVTSLDTLARIVNMKIQAHHVADRARRASAEHVALDLAAAAAAPEASDA